MNYKSMSNNKNKGKGGKKHRRGKNINTEIKVDLPDDSQYFAYVTKILGSGRVNLDYYIPTYDEGTSKIKDWIKHSKIGVIRGKMMRRQYVNLGDIVLVSEREFETTKVDIIDKYDPAQIQHLKKYVTMPPINEISNNDVEFDFDENVDEIISKQHTNNNYLQGMPSFSDSDDQNECEESE